MNRDEAIRFIQIQTGNKVTPALLSRYVGKGWVTPTRVSASHGIRYDYTEAECKRLIRRINAMPITAAAHLLSMKMNRVVSPARLRRLCADGAIPCIGKPAKIPRDKLGTVEAVLLRSDGMLPEQVAIDLVDAIQDASGLSMRAIARHVGKSPTLLHLILQGKRNMNCELYGKLVDLAKSVKVMEDDDGQH